MQNMRRTMITYDWLQANITDIYIQRIKSIPAASEVPTQEQIRQRCLEYLGDKIDNISDSKPTDELLYVSIAWKEYERQTT